MPQRPGHERRTDMYARAKSRPKRQPSASMELRRQSRGAGIKDPQQLKDMGRQISSTRRFSDERFLSPKHAEALNNVKPGTDGYTMTSVSRKPVGMGYTVTRHHKSGGSSSGGVFGNRNPVHIANDLINGANRADMKTWKE